MLVQGAYPVRDSVRRVADSVRMLQTSPEDTTYRPLNHRLKLPPADVTPEGIRKSREFGALSFVSAVLGLGALVAFCTVLSPFLPVAWLYMGLDLCFGGLALYFGFTHMPRGKSNGRILGVILGFVEALPLILVVETVAGPIVLIYDAIRMRRNRKIKAHKGR